MQALTLLIETDDNTWIETFANNFVNQNAQAFVTFMGADQQGGFEKLASATNDDKVEFMTSTLARRLLEQSFALEEERIIQAARTSMSQSRPQLPDIKKKDKK